MRNPVIQTVQRHPGVNPILAQRYGFVPSPKIVHNPPVHVREPLTQEEIERHKDILSTRLRRLVGQIMTPDKSFLSARGHREYIAMINQTIKLRKILRAYLIESGTYNIPNRLTTLQEAIASIGRTYYWDLGYVQRPGEKEIKQLTTLMRESLRRLHERLEEILKLTEEIFVIIIPARIIDDNPWTSGYRVNLLTWREVDKLPALRGNTFTIDDVWRLSLFLLRNRREELIGKLELLQKMVDNLNKKLIDLESVTNRTQKKINNMPNDTSASVAVLRGYIEILTAHAQK